MNSSSSSQITNDKGIPKQMALREISFIFETLKQKITGKLDSLSGDIQKQVISSNKTTINTSSVISFGADVLKSFEKVLSGEMAKLELQLTGERAFGPNIASTIEVDANIGFNFGANIYSQKHNMVIACPSNSQVYFHDATDLKALEQRNKKRIDSSVVQMSYNAETDTYLMGCAFGDIYRYNATEDVLTKVLKQGGGFVLAISHISPTKFAFSCSNSKVLYFGDVNSDTAVAHHSNAGDAWYLHHMNGHGLLVAGLSNGQIALYDTRKSQYPMVESFQAHRVGKYVTSIINAKINGREYVITGGNDKTIKIWHFVKGKMRLLKVIQNKEDISSIVYLEKYQMIATTHHRDFVKFFKVPSGELQTILPLGLEKVRNIFLMADKNSLGVADLNKNVIKVVQLHPGAEGSSQSREAEKIENNGCISEISKP